MCGRLYRKKQVSGGMTMKSYEFMTKGLTSKATLIALSVAAYAVALEFGVRIASDIKRKRTHAELHTIHSPDTRSMQPQHT